MGAIIDHNKDLECVGYTLWLCQQFAIENGHLVREFSHSIYDDFP